MTIPVCFGCGGSTAGGLTICGRYLCPGCEREILLSDTAKQDYDHWVARFRRFWEELNVEEPTERKS